MVLVTRLTYVRYTWLRGDPKKKGPVYTLSDISFIYSPIALILQDMAESTTVSTPRPQWELKQRIHCVKFYYKTGSFKKTQDSFMRQFECEKAPSKSRIQNWVDHFEEYGTVENLNAASENRPTHSGRPKKRTAELIESVRESLQQSPKRSVRKRSQSLSLSRETCSRVLVNDIRAYPYRIQTLQTLTVSDKKQRKAMAMAVKILKTDFEYLDRHSPSLSLLLV